MAATAPNRGADGDATLPLASVADLVGRVESLDRLERMAGVRDDVAFLDEASVHATALLSADACLFSRLDDDRLFDAGSHSPPPLVVADGHAYLVDDYPTTKRVLATRTPAVASLDDPAVDAGEAFVLLSVGARAVLLLPVVVEGRTWGLAEIYRLGTNPFRPADEALAGLFVFHVASLIARSENAARVRRLYRETLASLANALELKDTLTQVHTEEVVELALAIGERIGLLQTELEALELGALLHDIGKLRVPDSILKKPGPLSPDEWAIMREHPVVGETILKPIASLRDALPIVRSHHERWDGTGYPDGLVGTQIPLAARIVAVSDAYSAMAQHRPHRPRRTPPEIEAELRSAAGSQFDVDCVLHVLAVVSERARKRAVVPIRRPELLPDAAA
jgi:putative nucleotidyltransferase with HDIG domain